ncbi:MAG: hypothetical protein LBP76_00595 [Treponema sp.]|jgi:two-component system chemotaxis sensor kinase CheA|nr:hypothetical protein [Treponema sp.]
MSLKVKFFAIFIALGIVISLFMYIPYTDYIERSYRTTLKQVVTMIEKQYPVLQATYYLIGEGAARTDEFWDLTSKMNDIVNAFDLASIFYVRRYYNTFQNIFSSTQTPGAPYEDTLSMYYARDVPVYFEMAYESKQLLIPNAPYTDENGTYISAFLPITRNDEVVGILVAAMDISHINSLRMQAVLLLFISITAAAVASIVLADSVTTPIIKLKIIAEALSNADFNFNITKFRKDELGDMQHAMIKTRNNLHKMMTDLQSERDTITIMQDNLKAGIFLMDKDFIIQPQYSAALEEILMANNLAGRDFVSFLASSFTAKDLEGVRDYFSMMINRSVSQKKLENMNPLSELTYISVETNKEKILHCEFAAIDRGKEEIFILATIEDISREKRLQKKLEEEQRKQEGEMRSLFEIIKVEPQVLSDFMSDVEHNFNRITVILKDQNVKSQDAVVEIYQYIHAVKSDAFILGLEDFGYKLHELEAELKKLRQNYRIEFKDMLRITINIEKIFQEQDKLNTIIEKLRLFNIGGSRNQFNAESMFTESLKRASERIAKELQKKVQLQMEIELLDLKNIPRREIKETLIQLIRNAVYHGIESPEERIARGKNEVGTITLSMELENDNLHIILKDDGRGIDFDRIRKMAEEKSLIKTATVNKNYLTHLLFTPGFSTSDSENTYAGRGIGLSLVRAHIHDLHGTIKLQSIQGKGTIFTISIPVETELDINQVS